MFKTSSSADLLKLMGEGVHRLVTKYTYRTMGAIGGGALAVKAATGTLGDPLKGAGEGFSEGAQAGLFDSETGGSNKSGSAYMDVQDKIEKQHKYMQSIPPGETGELAKARTEMAKLRAESVRLASESKKEREAGGGSALDRKEGALSKLYRIVPRVGEAVSEGVVDPASRWLSANKGTAAALVGASVLPLGMLAYMNYQDKQRRRRELRKESGWADVGRHAATAAKTAVAGTPLYMYAAPDSWPMSKSKVFNFLYKNVAAAPVEKAVEGAVKDKTRFVDELLPEVGSRVGEAAADVVASPAKLVIGAAAPAVLYLAWRMASGGEDKAKARAARAMRSARERLEMYEGDPGLEKRAANWSAAAAKLKAFWPHAPKYAAVGGTGLISADVLLGNPGKRLRGAGKGLGAGFSNTVEKVVDALDVSAAERGARNATEAFLGALDKHKWPLLASLAGGSALLAAAKYYSERRERQADAEIEDEYDRIMARD